MTARNLDDLYRRAINSDARFQQLEKIPDALPDDDEIVQFVNIIGISDFVNFLNCFVGTDIRLQIAATASVLRAT